MRAAFLAAWEVLFWVSTSTLLNIVWQNKMLRVRLLSVFIRVWVQAEVEDAEGPTPEGKAAGEGETRERRGALKLQAVEIFRHLVLFKPVYRRQSRGHQWLGSEPAAASLRDVRHGGLQHDHGNTERWRRKLRFVDLDDVQNFQEYWIEATGAGGSYNLKTSNFKGTVHPRL